MNWSSLLTIVIIGAVFAIIPFYNRRKVKPLRVDADGWRTLRLDVLGWIMGLFGIALGLLFVDLIIGSVADLSDGGWIFLIIGPPMTALMGFSVFVTFWVRVAFSSEGVRHRGLRGWTQHPWDSVEGVTFHAGLGTRIRLTSGQHLNFWPTLSGMQELRSAFETRGLPFDLGNFA